MLAQMWPTRVGADQAGSTPLVPLTSANKYGRKTMIFIIRTLLLAATTSVIFVSAAESGTKCPAIVKPVCAIKNGVRITFNNACEAKRAGAKKIANGRCEDQK